ncbi:MAG: M28 family peptidase [Ignavibacteria bacterium]|nr:M28 family peptidase [Ignavibacteria bacterium]
MKYHNRLALLTCLLTFSLSSQEPRSLIQRMVNDVHADSLMRYVQTLQNFGTRYEYTPQQELAAMYILGEFSRWGVQAESDWFTFGMVTFYDLDLQAMQKGWVVGSAPGTVATTDGGQTWAFGANPANTFLLGVDFINPLVGLAVGYAGTILRTTDGGRTWLQRASGATTDLQDVSFGSERFAIAVGNGGIALRSTDGGISWVAAQTGTNNTLNEVKAIDSLTIWAVGNAGTIIHSSDGGLTWSQQVSSVSAILYGVDFVTPQLGWAVGSSASVIRTTNGGASWSKIASLPSTVQTLRGVYFRDSTHGWCVDYYGFILKTTDAGQTWTTALDLNAAGYWRPYLRKVRGDGSHGLMVCGARNLLFASTDNGATWAERSSNLPSAYSHTSRNIVAIIPGKVTPAKECVMVAHYDSYCSVDQNTAPGANDNASATSAVMEAVRIMRGYEFESTVKLVAVSAEEVGLLGSAHYAFTARRENRVIVGAVNGDMVGYAASPASTNLLYLGYYLSRGRLIDSAFVYNQRYGLGINLNVSSQSSSGSDHVPFTVAGFDALYVLSGSPDPDYHKPTDTYERLSPGLIRRAAQLMLATVAEIARPIRVATDRQPADPPTRFTLAQNFPNPFNSGTYFQFELPVPSLVTLKVFNLLGMEVATVAARPMEAGVHTIGWNPKGLASGVYLYRLQAESFTETKKLMLVR